MYNTIKHDDITRRERLGLGFLNNMDENAMQSIKKSKFGYYIIKINVNYNRKFLTERVIS